MKIKLVCSDIDGTLLNKDRELSSRTISAIKNLPIPFVLISSRMPKAMLHLQKELKITHLPMIAYNGGLIMDNNKVLHSTEINISICNAIAGFCESTKLHLSLYHRDEWFVPEMDYWAKREENNTKVSPQISPLKNTLRIWQDKNQGAHKIMCMGDENEIDIIVNYLEHNFKKEVIGYRSKPTYLEISPVNISKKTAIETLIQSNYTDLRLENVLAFGDNYNDIEMLKHSGIGVAVQNANKEVLKIADKITLTNKEDGVAIFLENQFR